MKRRRHTPEQIIRKLREAERMLAEGKTTAEVAKALEVSENTLHRWRNHYGGMKADDVRELKELRRENATLKRIVADKELENVALKEIAKGNFWPGPQAPSGRDAPRAPRPLRASGVPDRRPAPLHPTPRAQAGARRRRAQGISAAKPRWGYRRAHARLVEQGRAVNRKRVQRLWREEGLRVPARKRKRRRLGESTEEGKRLRAERPDHVWALDFQADETADGRQLRLLNVVDEFTREALAMDCARSITADQTVTTLERLVAKRGAAPAHIRCDNGPELTAHALRDWCRSSGAGTAYIEPGAPWQNPYVEAFNARVRDEVLDVELFETLAEARVILADWHAAYNAEHPHSALGMLAPVRFAARWRGLQATKAAA